MNEEEDWLIFGDKSEVFGNSEETRAGSLVKFDKKTVFPEVGFPRLPRFFVARCRPWLRPVRTGEPGIDLGCSRRKRRGFHGRSLVGVSHCSRKNEQ